MTIHRVRAPGAGTTDSSFAEATPLTRGPLDHLHLDPGRIDVPPPQRRYEIRRTRRPDHSRRNLVLGGVGALAILGAAVGLTAQPDLGWLKRATSTMPPPPPVDSVAASPDAATEPLPVEVAAAPRAPYEPPLAAPAETPAEARAAHVAPARTVTRSETLAVARTSSSLAPPPRAQISVAPPPRLPDPAPPAARAPIQLPTLDAPMVAATRPPPAVIRPGFNCAAAHNVSTRMVCADAELASYDRQLNGAYAQAVRAGVPRADLRADQDDWLRIREDAAHYSRQAVINVYRQRIGELNALARRPESYEALER